MIKDIIKTFKVNHWVKNLIVVFPLFFSSKFLNPDLWFNCATIFIAFSFISSAVYVFNDLIDIKKDKLHPIKRNRPIASGKISKGLAAFLMILLIVASSVLSYFLNKLCFLMIVLYFILNIFYSLILKNIVLIDAACIAIGFIFRIVAGCFAIFVLPSPLVILLTFFLSMFFTFSKRKLELKLLDEKTECRTSLKGLDSSLVAQFILFNAILSVAFYFTYVLDASTIERAGTKYLYLTTIPFSLIIFRLLLLVNVSKVEDDPIYFVEKDIYLKWLFLFYIVTLIFVLSILK